MTGVVAGSLCDSAPRGSSTGHSSSVSPGLSTCSPLLWLRPHDLPSLLSPPGQPPGALPPAARATIQITQRPPPPPHHLKPGQSFPGAGVKTQGAGFSPGSSCLTLPGPRSPFRPHLPHSCPARAMPSAPSIQLGGGGSAGLQRSPGNHSLNHRVSLPR